MYDGTACLASDTYLHRARPIERNQVKRRAWRLIIAAAAGWVTALLVFSATTPRSVLIDRALNKTKDINLTVRRDLHGHAFCEYARSPYPQGIPSDIHDRQTRVVSSTDTRVPVPFIFGPARAPRSSRTSCIDCTYEKYRDALLRPRAIVRGQLFSVFRLARTKTHYWALAKTVMSEGWGWMDNRFSSAKRDDDFKQTFGSLSNAERNYNGAITAHANVVHVRPWRYRQNVIKNK